MIKRMIAAAVALSLCGGVVAIAGEHDHDFYRHDVNHQYDRVHWGRGDHFSGHYVVVDDWRGHHLRRPPHGYRWVETDDGDFVLVAISTGIILDMMMNAGH